MTGVEDAVFCHNNLFIAGAASMEGAVRLAQGAVDYWAQREPQQPVDTA